MSNLPHPAPRTHHERRHRARRTFALLRGRSLAAAGLIAAVVSLCLPAPSANADASVVGSTPVAGQQLSTLPERFEVTFDEQVQQPTFMTVSAPDGSRVNSDLVQIRGRTVSSDMLGAAKPGTYVVSYRVTSADDHRVTDKFTFSVRADAGVPSATDSADPPSPSPSGTADDSVTVVPSAGVGSSGVEATIVILIFFVIAMAGLVLMVRAGLRSVDAEDEDDR
jgi:methionine-rich copper-binding protein CopC